MDDRDWRLMVIPLKFTWQATEEELGSLKDLVCFRLQKCQSGSMKEHDYTRPSLIIDGFLYHGDLKHVTNGSMLEELNIQCIVNVSDCQLPQEIVNQRHTLWINVDDDTYSDIAQYFEMTNAFLSSSKEKGKCVLVHCQMGLSRSSTIVLAYLIK